MRTIVEIPEELLKPLDLLCEREDISRAEAIREAVGKLLAEKEAIRKKVTIDDVFGLWKDRDDIGDSVEYVRKLRSEWDREWDSEAGEWVYPVEGEEKNDKP